MFYIALLLLSTDVFFLSSVEYDKNNKLNTTGWRSLSSKIQECIVM